MGRQRQTHAMSASLSFQDTSVNEYFNSHEVNTRVFYLLNPLALSSPARYPRADLDPEKYHQVVLLI